MFTFHFLPLTACLLIVAGTTIPVSAQKALPSKATVYVTARTAVNVSMYDCAGRKVATIVNTPMDAGTHAIRKDLSRVLCAGSYVVKIAAGNCESALKVAVW